MTAAATPAPTAELVELRALTTGVLSGLRVTYNQRVRLGRTSAERANAMTLVAAGALQVIDPEELPSWFDRQAVRLRARRLVVPTVGMTGPGEGFVKPGTEILAHAYSPALRERIAELVRTGAAVLLDAAPTWFVAEEPAYRQHRWAEPMRDARGRIV